MHKTTSMQGEVFSTTLLDDENVLIMCEFYVIPYSVWLVEKGKALLFGKCLTKAVVISFNKLHTGIFHFEAWVMMT